MFAAVAKRKVCVLGGMVAVGSVIVRVPPAQERVPNTSKKGETKADNTQQSQTGKIESGNECLNVCA